MSNSPFEPAIPFTEGELIAIEKTLRRKLPEDYCKFVREYGGAFVGGLIDGEPELPILSFFSADAKSGILWILEFHSDLYREHILPIASCALGNLYVLTPENAVYYINYYGSDTTARKVADSFDDLVARIVLPKDSE